MDAIWNSRKCYYLRPVIAGRRRKNSPFPQRSEANVVNNAYGYTDSKGNFVDQSDRTGYGMSMTWNGLKTNSGKWHRG